uniref:Uncharacterized protein n=1 Tax=Molossus molossus TaxID=27622 RepID=A0A7J8IZY8_MOLMO|nr:hypothetical protein HJG59_010338 [Molossus molossus]
MQDSDSPVTRGVRSVAPGSRFSPVSTWSISAEGSGCGACGSASWHLPHPSRGPRLECALTPHAGARSTFTKGAIFCGIDYLNSSTRWKKTHLTVERPSTEALMKWKLLRKAKRLRSALPLTNGKEMTKPTGVELCVSSQKRSILLCPGGILQETGR